ncbi:ATP-dependent DNA helicase DinG [Neobacillus dielmonensis]|uniref:ATP-dependent DNA helicase DinG n=1 Tax=Neobacillus dielmonensis TaxID=1347369 RepID=UPI0005A81C93|nr:ATP-dependent DNA helicase DinG [Neobacillus dielmonensis]
MLNKFVVVDLETTGNLPKKGDKIIQFAAVVIENGKVTEKFSSLVNPQKSIPPFIEELTGINDEMVKDAPEFAEIADRVNSLLEDAYFVAHNVLFDLSFLQEELIQAGCGGFYGSVLDTVEMARILYPTADSYKLSDLAEKENLNHNRPHQADSDAEVTAELFLIFLNRLEKLPTVTLQQLLPLSEGLKSDLHLLLDELLIEWESQGKQLDNALEWFNRLALRKQHRQIGSHKDEKVFPYPADNDVKLELLKKGLGTYQKRTGQFNMMDTVYHAFDSKKHALIEAGTGIGKSLGYLLPIAYFSVQHQKPIVVSTHTTQLQEQLLKKDIPDLNRMLPFEVDAVILKGKGHYLSLEKFYQSLENENDNYDTTLTKMQILIWLLETETGDKDELNLSSGGLLFWNKIKTDASIFPENPIWQERDFYKLAKIKAESANIIITNHSLLLSDIKEQGSILPEYHFAIIDEGHHLEKTAAQFFGYSLDYLSTRMWLGHFGQYEQRQLFYKLEKMFEGLPDFDTELPHTFEVGEIFANLTYEIDDFFKLVGIFAKSKQAGSNSPFRTKISFSNSDNSKQRKALVHSAERLAFSLSDLQAAVEGRLEWLKSKKTTYTNEQENIITDLYIWLNELVSLKNTIKSCFMRDSNHVKWIEIDFRSPQNVTAFMAQPTSVAGTLQEKFFSVKDGIVITSATLTVNQSFDYVIKELGLNPEDVHQLVIPSPFEYKNQVQMLIPSDLPEVNSVSLDEYVVAISEQIISIAEATKGRMMILFTANDMLKKTYELIRESGFLEDYVLIAQGITGGSRMRLTRSFQRFEKAILFGTGSFWEGVDIPGEDLSCLVIVRLPFSSPEEPITQAKCQIIKEQGGNPFTEYSLPEAILRFKQGFGRLIRSETDRGIVMVFDKRIITTKYGKNFLESIPPVSIKKGPMTDLIKVIETWL